MTSHLRRRTWRIRSDSPFDEAVGGTKPELTPGLYRVARRMLRQAPGLPLHLPMPCQRLAVKDAEGAAQRSKILDGEGHGHTLSRAARPERAPRSSKPAN